MHTIKRFKFFLATLIVLFAIFIYINKFSTKIECHQEYIPNLSEKKLIKTTDFDIIFSKKFFEKSLETVSDGQFTIYGNFGNKCRLPKPDGYQGYYRTFIDSNHYIITVSAFKVDSYTESYEYLLNELVKKGESIIIDDNYLFWIQNDVYYLVEARPIVIQKLKQAINLN